MDENEIERDVVRSATWQLMRRAPTWLLVAIVVGAVLISTEN